MIRKIIEKISSNFFLRNLILALSLILAFVVASSILLNVITRHNSSTVIPDFSGVSLHEAQTMATKASVNLEIVDSLYVVGYDGGIILDQFPAANTSVKPGRRVFITTNAYSLPKTEIPYVTGFSLRQAKNNLEVVGLEIDKLIFTPDLAGGNVLKESYNGETITPSSKVVVPVGSAITLEVGLGSNSSSQVPKVVGLPLREAKSRMWEVGMNIEGVSQDDSVTPLNMSDARVIRQSIAPGLYQRLGTGVKLTISAVEEKINKAVKTTKVVADTKPSTEEEVDKNE